MTTTTSPSDPTVTLLWSIGGDRITRTFLVRDPTWRQTFQHLARSQATVAIRYSRPNP